MTSHQTETPDWMSLKWAESDPFPEPGFNPYINDPEGPFDETFGYPTDWNSSSFGPQIDSSFRNLQQLSSDVTGPAFGSDLRLRTAPLYLNTGAKTNRVDQSFSEEAEDDEDGDLMSDIKTSPVTPSSTTKNSFIPTWQSPTKVQIPDTFKTSSSAPKRQKRSKPSNADTSISSNSPDRTRRRSQRKRSISTKVTESYMETPTEASSPETTLAPDVENQDAAFKNKKSHNLTEKKYRNRLNGYFDTLLAAIPRKPGMSESDDFVLDIPERKISKGEVLVLALEHIRALEKQRDVLEQEKKDMGNSLARLKSIYEDLGGEIL